VADLIARVRAVALVAVLPLLGGCPGTPCSEAVDLEIGTGNRASGFLELDEPALLPMWSVRHEWNRMVPVNLRAHGLDCEDDDRFGLRLGLYQQGELVAGTSVNDAAPEQGEVAEFLGLLAQVVTYEYEPLSGRPTRVQAELTDRCGTVFSDELDAEIWAPEDLCALDPEQGTVAVGAGDPFEVLAPLDEVEVVPVGDGEGLAVSARASNATSPLTASYVVRRVVLLDGGDEVGRLEPAPEYPDRWTLEQADFLGLEVPFAGPSPEPGVEVEVRVVLSDACGREVQAELPLVLR